MKRRKSKTDEGAADPEDLEIAALRGYAAKSTRELLTEMEATALLAAAETVWALKEELRRQRASIRRLREMLFGPSTERTERVCPPPPGAAREEAEKPASSKRPGHGRNPASCYRGAERIRVEHPDLMAGDECPECPKGKVYPMAEPAVMLRIVGMSPLSAKAIERERLRCNGCGEVFKAPTPEGMGEEKYGSSLNRVGSWGPAREFR